MIDLAQRCPETPFEILLVEDNPGDVRLIEAAAKTTDFETVVRVTAYGDAALDLLAKRAEETSVSFPDLVLLDLNLPDGDGCRVLEAIRDHDRLPYLPVIMLTSSESRNDVTRCYGAAANAYVPKPSGDGEYASLMESIERFWFEQVTLPPKP